jgi:hypothetical protein
MAAKHNRLTRKIAIQLHVVAEGCTICSSRSRRPVRKLWDTPSYRCLFIKKVKMIKLFLFLTKYYAMETDWVSGDIAPCILNFGTRRTWVVSFTPRPLYNTRGRKPRYPLDRRPGGPQNRSGRVGEEKKIPVPPGNRIPFVQPVAA